MLFVQHLWPGLQSWHGFLALTQGQLRLERVADPKQLQEASSWDGGVVHHFLICCPQDGWSAVAKSTPTALLGRLEIGGRSSIVLLNFESELRATVLII